MTISPLAGRLLALAILAALLWAANAFALRPLLGAYRQNEAEIAAKHGLGQQFRRIGQSRQALESKLDEVRERLSPDGLYLRAASDALVAAELQDRVKTLVEANGGKLNSTQSLPARDEGGFRRITIRVQMTVFVAPMQTIFHTLESAKPYLFLDNVDIRRRVQRRRRARNQQEEGPERESTLTVRFDLYGYTRDGGA